MRNPALPRKKRFRFLRGALASCLIGAWGQAGAASTEGQLPPGVTVHEGLVYSPSGTGLKMDLFLPPDTGQPVACVIVIQGGGFRPQDGKRFRHYAARLTANGFAAALIAYRGRPDHNYRDSIADVKTAVRYLRKISGDYNLDPARIGATGSSAGGTLVALLAVTAGAKDLEGGAHADYSSRIQAAVAYAGVFDFIARFTEQEQIVLQPRLDEKIATNGEWIGVPFSATSEPWRNASAMNHIDASDSPILLLHCKNDKTVPWIQSQDMFARLQKAGVPSEIVHYETGDHGFKVKGPDDPMEPMIVFFKKVLKVKPPGAPSRS